MTSPEDGANLLLYSSFTSGASKILGYVEEPVVLQGRTHIGLEAHLNSYLP